MPLYAYIIAHLKQAAGEIDTLRVGLIYQFVVQFLNAIMLYVLGKKVLQKEDIAFKAAVLYVFNHSMVYQMAL